MRGMNCTLTEMHEGIKDSPAYAIEKVSINGHRTLIHNEIQRIHRGYSRPSNPRIQN